MDKEKNDSFFVKDNTSSRKYLQYIEGCCGTLERIYVVRDFRSFPFRNTMLAVKKMLERTADMFVFI
jgi:hypothetical protein